MRAVLILGMLLLALALLSASAILARGDDEEHSDHDRARHAVEQSRARPLADIFDQVRARIGGKVIISMSALAAGQASSMRCYGDQQF